MITLIDRSDIYPFIMNKGVQQIKDKIFASGRYLYFNEGSVWVNRPDHGHAIIGFDGYPEIVDLSAIYLEDVLSCFHASGYMAHHPTSIWPAKSQNRSGQEI